MSGFNHFRPIYTCYRATLHRRLRRVLFGFPFFLVRLRRFSSLLSASLFFFVMGFLTAGSGGGGGWFVTRYDEAYERYDKPTLTTPTTTVWKPTVKLRYLLSTTCALLYDERRHFCMVGYHVRCIFCINRALPFWWELHILSKQLRFRVFYSNIFCCERWGLSSGRSYLLSSLLL